MGHLKKYFAPRDMLQSDAFPLDVPLQRLLPSATKTATQTVKTFRNGTGANKPADGSDAEKVCHLCHRTTVVDRYRRMRRRIDDERNKILHPTGTALEKLGVYVTSLFLQRRGTTQLLTFRADTGVVICSEARCSGRPRRWGHGCGCDTHRLRRWSHRCRRVNYSEGGSAHGVEESFRVNKKRTQNLAMLRACIQHAWYTHVPSCPTCLMASDCSVSCSDRRAEG